MIGSLTSQIDVTSLGETLYTIAFTVFFPEVVLYLPKFFLPESVGCFKNPSGTGYICPP